MRFPMLLLPAVLLLACGWNYDMKSLGPEQCRLHLADRRSQTAQPGSQGIRLAWNAGSYRRAELLFTDRPLLPPFRRATIALSPRIAFLKNVPGSPGLFLPINYH